MQYLRFLEVNYPVRTTNWIRIRETMPMQCTEKSHKIALKLLFYLYTFLAGNVWVEAKWIERVKMMDREIQKEWEREKVRECVCVCVQLYVICCVWCCAVSKERIGNTMKDRGCNDISFILIKKVTGLRFVLAFLFSVRFHSFASTLLISFVCTCVCLFVQSNSNLFCIKYELRFITMHLSLLYLLVME